MSAISRVLITILCVQKFIRSIEGAYLHGVWRFIGSYLANKGEKGKITATTKTIAVRKKKSGSNT